MKYSKKSLVIKKILKMRILEAVQLPLSYYMSIQPNASLTQIGLAAPIATINGIILNVCFYIYLNKKLNQIAEMLSFLV